MHFIEKDERYALADLFTAANEPTPLLRSLKLHPAIAKQAAAARWIHTMKAASPAWLKSVGHADNILYEVTETELILSKLEPWPATLDGCLDAIDAMNESLLERQDFKRECLRAMMLHVKAINMNALERIELEAYARASGL